MLYTVYGNMYKPLKTLSVLKLLCILCFCYHIMVLRF